MQMVVAVQGKGANCGAHAVGEQQLGGAPREELRESLRIVHVVLSMEPGGLERIVAALVRNSRNDGQKADVLCLERAGALAGEVEQVGGQVICVDKPPGLKLSTIGRVKAALGELRPHIVHTHQIGALFYTGPAAKSLGIPGVVHTEHGRHFGTIRGRWLMRWASGYADRFFCVSDDIAAEAARLNAVNRKKIGVVRNGIDLAPFDCPSDLLELRQSLGICPTAPVIGTIGRLTEVKRQDVLVRAFAQVRTTRPDAQLLIVGDGPLRQELVESCERLKLGGHVHFVGYQKEPDRYLRMMDVFCLTSRSEGMPLVILEAWAARVCVVAADVGGIPELVKDDQTGRLVPGGDVDRLAQVINSLLSSPQRRLAITERARREVEEKYTLRQMSERYHGEYARLLGARGGNGNYGGRLEGGGSRI